MPSIPLPVPTIPDVFSFGFDTTLTKPIQQSPVVYDSSNLVNMGSVASGGNLIAQSVSGSMFVGTGYDGTGAGLPMEMRGSPAQLNTAGAGGDILVRGGVASSLTSATGGSGGNIKIIGGTSGRSADAGDVVIVPGNISTGGSKGYIRMQNPATASAEAKIFVDQLTTAGSGVALHQNLFTMPANSNALVEVDWTAKRTDVAGNGSTVGKAVAGFAATGAAASILGTTSVFLGDNLGGGNVYMDFSVSGTSAQLFLRNIGLAINLTWNYRISAIINQQ